MKRELNIVVNGESYNFFIEPKTLLVQVLREMLRFTGTHQACDSSSCAACTVIIEGKPSNPVPFCAAGERERSYDH
jgi:carbon-monoxide dehydrogenase small subunit